MHKRAALSSPRPTVFKPHKPERAGSGERKLSPDREHLEDIRPRSPRVTRSLEPGSPASSPEGSVDTINEIVKLFFPPKEIDQHPLLNQLLKLEKQVNEHLQQADIQSATLTLATVILIAKEKKDSIEERLQKHETVRNLQGDQLKLYSVCTNIIRNIGGLLEDYLAQDPNRYDLSKQLFEHLVKNASNKNDVYKWKKAITIMCPIVDAAELLAIADCLHTPERLSVLIDYITPEALHDKPEYKESRERNDLPHGNIYKVKEYVLAHTSLQNLVITLFLTQAAQGDPKTETAIERKLHWVKWVRESIQDPKLQRKLLLNHGNDQTFDFLTQLQKLGRTQAYQQFAFERPQEILEGFTHAELEDIFHQLRLYDDGTISTREERLAFLADCARDKAPEGVDDVCRKIATDMFRNYSTMRLQRVHIGTPAEAKSGYGVIQAIIDFFGTTQEKEAFYEATEKLSIMTSTQVSAEDLETILKDCFGENPSSVACQTLLNMSQLHLNIVIDMVSLDFNQSLSGPYLNHCQEQKVHTTGTAFVKNNGFSISVKRNANGYPEITLYQHLAIRDVEISEEEVFPLVDTMLTITLGKDGQIVSQTIKMSPSDVPPFSTILSTGAPAMHFATTSDWVQGGLLAKQFA